MAIGTRIAPWFAPMALAFTWTCSARAEEPPASIDEVIITDEEPAAFFERAPRELSRKMRAAMGRECEHLPSDTLHCTEIELVFLREVSELGNRTQSGYACVGEDMYLRNRYFAPASVYSNPTCVPVSCYERDSSCEISADLLKSARRRWAPNTSLEPTRGR